jgi:hypothetical protein
LAPSSSPVCARTHTFFHPRRLNTAATSLIWMLRQYNFYVYA